MAEVPEDMRGETAMEFLAALVTDEREAAADRFDEFCGGSPQELMVGLSVLLALVGAMATTLDGNPGTWGFETTSRDGEPVPAEVTWASQFITASMNGDYSTAYAVWHTPASADDLESVQKQADHLMGMAIPLMRDTTARFLKSGKTLDLTALSPWQQTTEPDLDPVTTMRGLDVTRTVWVCMACHHWQVDIHPRGRSEHGGTAEVMRAVAQAHHDDHHADCPGAGGRVKFNDQWVDPPKLPDGRQADAALSGVHLPRWWVWR